MGRIELRVTVEWSVGANDTSVDLCIDVGSAATVGDLLLALANCDEALSQHLEAVVDSGGFFGIALAHGAVAGVDERIADLPIAHGDVVRLVEVAVPRSPASPPVIVELSDPKGNASAAIIEIEVGDAVEVGRSHEPGALLADPSVSRRHARLAWDGELLKLDDLDSTNGTVVAGRDVDGTVEVADGSSLRFGDVDVVLHLRYGEARPVVDAATRVVRQGVVELRRPPMASVVPTPVVLDAPSLPPAPVEHRLPWISASVPLLIAAVFVVVTLRTGQGFDSSYTWLSIAFLLLSPVMLVAGHWEAVRWTRRRERSSQRRFEADFMAVSDAATSAKRVEESVRRRAHPGPRQMELRAALLTPGLWDGADRPDERLRVGVGGQPSGVEIRRSTTADCSDSAKQVEELAESVAVVDDVPILVSVPSRALTRIGIAGSDSWRRSVARALVLQFASTLPPGRLAFRLPHECEVAGWAWVKWLPHDVTVGRCDQPTSAVGTTRVVVVDGNVTPWRSGVRVDGRVVELWVGSSVDDLPSDCAVVLEPGVSTDIRTGAATAVIVDVVDSSTAERWARRLAPVVDSAAGPRAAVPSRASLREVVGPDGVDAETVLSAWRARPGSLVAPIGLHHDGVLTVDLVEHGPHAIIAGMTGSGKSELLQTLVVSLSASRPPSEVTFLLVDYKGGAAFAECVHLPHCVGLVTDLDEPLVGRVLVSLKAELRRRERLLADAGHPNIASWGSAFRSGAAVKAPPPSLVVVVDEFAALALSVPSFVDGLVDVARRGRSLGVHLVLATQRPTGVVSDQLRSNASIRIALRVSDVADSMDVVGIPDAASFDRSTPGRALAILGRPETVEFQTAFCGGHDGVHPEAADPSAVRITPFTFAESPPYRPSDGADPVRSDLAEMVEVIGEAFDASGEGRPVRPWIEPLPNRLRLADLLDRPDGISPGDDAAMSWPALLGLCDVPDDQRQEVRFLDLADGATVLFGGGSSPLEAVTAIVTSAVRGRSPETVRVDVLDDESGSLRRLDVFPQVGSVIAPDDLERVVRLGRDLRGEVGRPTGRFPRRLLVIADLAGLTMTLESRGLSSTLDDLARVAADGGPGGVHVIAVADRRIGLPGGLLAAMSRRIVMRMASPDDLSTLGVPEGDLPAEAPGRAVLDGVQIQTAVAGDEELAATAAIDRALFCGISADPIGVLPASIAAASITRAGGASGWSALVGIGDTHLSAARIDLGAGNLMIAGPMGSGRTSALLTVAASTAVDGSSVRRVLVVPRSSSLEAWSGWDLVAVGDEGAGIARRLASEATSGAGPTVVYVDDATELGTEVDAELALLAAVSRRHDLRLVVAAEAALARSSYGGILAALRRERRALLLQPDVELDGDLAGVRLRRRPWVAVPPGRGELVLRGQVELVQVALTSLTDDLDPDRREVM